jgi:hypothetical protein
MDKIAAGRSAMIWRIGKMRMRPVTGEKGLQCL